MNPDAVCCQQLPRWPKAPSPFARVIVLDWYDGPRVGLLECGQCGREYRFDLLDEQINDEEGRDVRVLSLAPLAEGSLARLTAALAPYQTPRWPVWVPLWQFPTKADQAALDHLTDQLLNEAGPPEWVIATPDLAEEVLAARASNAEDLERVDDWFAFLGLVKTHVRE